MSDEQFTFVLVPTEITRKMRMAAWIADYLAAGASEAEALVLAARREADDEEVASANATYQAMLAASPKAPLGDEGDKDRRHAMFMTVKEWDDQFPHPRPQVALSKLVAALAKLEAGHG